MFKDNIYLPTFKYTWGIANPAAGANLILPVPAGKIWNVLSLKFAFQCGAAVANRNVQIRIYQDGTNSYCSFVRYCQVNQVANEGRDYIAGDVMVNMTEVASPFQWTTMLPMRAGGLWIIGGGRIQIEAVNMQAADQFMCQPANQAGVEIHEFNLGRFPY